MRPPKPSPTRIPFGGGACGAVCSPVPGVGGLVAGWSCGAVWSAACAMGSTPDLSLMRPPPGQAASHATSGCLRDDRRIHIRLGSHL